MNLIVYACGIAVIYMAIHEVITPIDNEEREEKQ